MEKIIALKYKLVDGKPEYTPLMLDFSKANVFEQLRYSSDPTCLVVSESDVEFLSEQRYFIHLLGEKKRVIQPARYFKKAQKHTVPLLVCHYSDKGRLDIGIKSIFNYFQNDRGLKIVMISVSALIFETLHKLSEGWVVEQIFPQEVDKATDAPNHGDKDDNPQSLLDRLGDNCEPHDLKNIWVCQSSFNWFENASSPLQVVHTQFSF